MKVSPKFRKFDINHNEKLLVKIKSCKSDWLDKFFDMNYLKLFYYYYNNQKPLSKIKFEGVNIEVSETTKCFYYLLERNPKDKDKLINTTINDYLNGNDILLFLSEKKKQKRKNK